MEYVDLIKEKNPLHSKYLNKLTLSENKLKDLNHLILFYQNNLNFSLEEQARNYIVVLNDT
ncbi:class I SAM-dependent methyltransferase, partial [Campylobacter novaezeelandiae]|nr:class I SAM-dependent methyltransferase [Campylobacter novaezeelandiae]